MSAPKEETTSILYSSTEEFVSEYKKICRDKSKAEEFYLDVLIELEQAIVEGNIDNFKILSNVIDCVSDLEDQVTLKDYYDNINNPIRRTNLVILTSKHDKMDILEYLFGSETKVLNSLSVCIGKTTISPKDEDERHNAFYYAIRSDNIALLNTLIDKWPDNYFNDRSEELDGFLSRAYAELKLKNVPLSVESEMHVEKILTDLRFFSNSSGQVQSITTELVNIRQRVELLLESVRLLTRDYSGTEKVDGKFLFVAKSIAQNISILKRQIKSTYDKLPWEEMEFCLVIFVYSQAKTKPQALNLFYRYILTKHKILNYLEHFAKRLEDEKSNIKGDKLHCFPTNQVVKKKTKEITEVVKTREEILTDIISSSFEFELLIKDFQQVRDMHSLQKIGDHIKWALACDVGEIEGKLIVTRSLQVIGEHLKYTLESPKLSRNTGDRLVSLFPKNAKTIITNLRDSISHAESLSMRMEIASTSDVSYFINIRNEIKTVGGVITDILYKNKVETIRALLEKIGCSRDLNDIKEILEELEDFDIFESVTGSFKRSEHENLEKLVEKFSKNIPNKTNHEKGLLKKINKIIYCGGTRSETIISEYMTGYHTLRAISVVLGDNKIDDNLIEQIKRVANDIIKEITSDIEPHNLLQIAKLSLQIFDSARPRMRDEKLNEVNLLLEKICMIAEFEIGGINLMERFRDKLKNKVASQRDNGTKDSKYNIGLQLTKLLKDILDKYPLNNPLYIITYKSNKKLQLAVEMLVLDIMSILESDLENNQLCLDDHSPILIGKCLRNHLAHDNPVVDVLLTDRSRSVILNAKKLSRGNIMASEKNIGKLVYDDPIRLRDKYRQDLFTITKQEEMFIALKDGKVESFKDCLTNGADIKARSINLRTTLHFAAMGPGLEIIKFILDQGVDVNVEDDNGQTPLHVAAAYGRQDIVAYFITEAGAPVDKPNYSHKTALHVAAQNGHVGTVEELINNGANCSAHDESGFSPLRYAISNYHVDTAKILVEKSENAGVNETVGGFTTLYQAAQYGQVELVNFLLNNGADVNSTNDEDNKTPLDIAAFRGYLDVVKALIEKGANVNSRNAHYCTPLHFAAFGRNIEVIKFLVDSGADVNAVDKTCGTPLHYAAKMADDYEGNVTTLLDKYADPNFANEMGMTPLHFAANYNNLNIVRVLCEQPGVDINVKCNDESTPLHYAANCGHNKVVEFLLGKEAHVNATNKKNLTALYVAALNGHTDVADLLISNNADFHLGDEAGYMPLHLAAKNGNKDIVELLVKIVEVDALCNRGYSALHLAVLEGHKDIVDLLIEYNAQVNIDGCEIEPFLMAAIFGGSKEIVESLLTNGAQHAIIRNPIFLRYAIGLNKNEIVDVLMANGANIGEYVGEALLIAIARGHSDVVEVLLKHKVDVNKNDFLPISPLHLAAQMGYKKMVIALIGRGAEVDAKNDDNVTPLGLAALNGHDDVVQYLIERKGAKVDGEPGMGPKPLHLAASKGHRNVIQILLDNGADINIKDDDNNTTPIEIAASLGQLQGVITLLESKKIDTNAKGDEDYTLLHYASLGNNLELLEYLVKRGSNINAENSRGYKPMHGAAEKGNKDVVEFFLNKGIGINDSVIDNSTMLHMAAFDGHFELANYLIDKGADVNPKDINGMTPMFFAAAEGHIGLVEIFLDKGVNINSLDGPCNTTILHLAAAKGDLELAHYLITRGADFNVKSSNGETPIELLVRKNGQFNKTLLEMAENNDVNNLLASIKKSCRVIKSNNSSDEEEAHCSRTEVLKKTSQGYKAIKGNNSSDEEEEAHCSRTEEFTKDIYFAAKHGDIVTVRRLLEGGADPNEKDVNGETLLHYAILFKHMDVVDILLEYGADVAQVTNKEKTSSATRESFEYKLINTMQHISQIKLNHYVNDKTTSGGAESHPGLPKLSYWEITKALMDQGVNHDMTDIEKKNAIENSKQQDINDLLQLIEDLCN